MKWTILFLTVWCTTAHAFSDRVKRALEPYSFCVAHEARKLVERGIDPAGHRELVFIKCKTEAQYMYDIFTEELGKELGEEMYSAAVLEFTNAGIKIAKEWTPPD